MAWAHASTSGTVFASSDPWTLAHTLASGSNRLMTVGISNEGSTTVTDVTFNGVSMDEAAHAAASAGDAYVYYLLEAELPSGGSSYDVVANFSGNTIGYMFANCYTGVNQATPQDTNIFQSTSGGATTSSVVLDPTTANGLGVDCVHANNAGDGNPSVTGTNQNSRGSLNTASNAQRGAVSDIILTGSATTMSWNLNGSTNARAHAAAGWLEAASATPKSFPPPQITPAMMNLLMR